MSSIYTALSLLEDEGEIGVLCTIVSATGSTPRKSGSKMLVYPDGKIVGTIGGGELESRVKNEALDALKTHKPRLIEYSMTDPKQGDPGVCGGQLKIFVEPIMPKPNLIIVGGGHVGKEVASLGAWLDFQIIICDDRPEFATPEMIPDADAYFSGPIETILEELKVNPWSYFVLTTRNVDVDVKFLPALLDTEAAYIGVIGSRRRWATTRQRLIDLGIDPAKIDQIHSPIGLNLNAETPREIAVSILSEIIMIQKNGDNNSMSEKKA